ATALQGVEAQLIGLRVGHAIKNPRGSHCIDYGAGAARICGRVFLLPRLHFARMVEKLNGAASDVCDFREYFTDASHVLIALLRGAMEGNQRVKNGNLDSVLYDAVSELLDGCLGKSELAIAPRHFYLKLSPGHKEPTVKFFLGYAIELHGGNQAPLQF